jgi:hypothetical protein
VLLFGSARDIRQRGGIPRRPATRREDVKYGLPCRFRPFRDATSSADHRGIAAPRTDREPCRRRGWPGAEFVGVMRPAQKAKPRRSGAFVMLFSALRNESPVRLPN